MVMINGLPTKVLKVNFNQIFQIFVMSEFAESN